ncbi:MAG: hypothetical protein QM652_10115 [Legionella sp.]|uniref:hypothetical protein n=1 Tax=Legionella sp. TaxID=459 RepID=UPI0039E43EB7
MSQILDLDSSSGQIGSLGLLVGVIALNLYLQYTLPRSEKIYKGSQPGMNGENNGFYLVEDNSIKFGR